MIPQLASPPKQTGATAVASLALLNDQWTYYVLALFSASAFYFYFYFTVLRRMLFLPGG